MSFTQDNDKCGAPQSPGCIHPVTHYVSYESTTAGVRCGDGVFQPATTYARVCGWCVDSIPNRLTVELLSEPAAKKAVPHPTSGDVPRVLKVKVRRDGGHVKVRVYIGQEGSPCYCGELTMRPDEYREFRDVLMLGIATPGPKASISYEGDACEWLNPTASMGGVACHE